MRVIILTSSRRGTAAHHLPVLLRSPGIEVRMVLYSRGVVRDKWKHYKRKLNKVFKIGLLGTLNGIRMRRWYTTDLENYLKIDDIQSICERENVVYHEVDTINSVMTRTYFSNANADLGISLGNGYIGESVFSIPRLGMINIHHEILPDFQNAQSVIWQLFNGSVITGYSIHVVEKRIDAGNILFQEKMPILFQNTLAETVSSTYASLLNRSAKGLVYIIENFEKFSSSAVQQGSGKKFTTPGILDFLTIRKNYLRLKKIVPNSVEY